MNGRLALLALLAVPVTSCTGHERASSAYLFIVDAPVGEVVEVDSGFELVLRSDTSVTWFTDRPYRQAGNLSMADFADAWAKDGYNADPPQAALDLSIDGSDETFVVELGAPHLDGDSYHIPLSDVQVENTEPAEHAGRVATMKVAAGHLEEVSMFIDSTKHCSACKVVGA